ncbi:MAG: hypothetical protein RL148_2399 [Planctomycetota bacterium]
MDLVEVVRKASRRLETLHFGPPVACTYNPLDYAWDVHRAWLERYGSGRKEALFVGMNPGPFGMVQTGVPFGEVAAVRGWLGLEGRVRAPERVHPKRPVEGFACTRSEVSGRRVWNWAATRFGRPEAFFRRFFVHNYCPLAFVAESGANLTPDKLPAAMTEPLFRLCDQMLADVVELLEPSLVIGFGAFAEGRAREVLAGKDIRVGRVLHPSPASPAANRGWEPQVEKGLRALGVSL